MAASLEYLLLSKIVQTGDFHTVEKLKITEEYLTAPECRELFLFLQTHYHSTQTYGTVPSWQIVQQYHPQFPLTWGHPDPIQVLCEEIRKARIRAQLMALADEIYSNAQSDPRNALGTVREAAATLAFQHELSQDLLLSDSYEALHREYEMVRSGVGVTGIPWPWAILSEDTQGMHPGDFIVFYGRPKEGKSFIGLLVGTNAYLHHRRRVLVYSMEMKAIQVQRRSAAIMAEVDYQRFRRGRLTPFEYDRLFQQLQFLREQEHTLAFDEFHIPQYMATTDDDEGGGGISSLSAKIKEFKPDLVIIDGVYLMRDDQIGQRTPDWKAISHISRGLKRLAKQYEIPIVGIHQANRQAVKNNSKDGDLSEIAYSDAIGQDCDLLIRVKQEKDSNTGETEIVLGFPGSRESALDAFVIHFAPCYNFTFKRVIQKDSPENQPPPSNGAGTRPKASPVGPVLPYKDWRSKK